MRITQFGLITILCFAILGCAEDTPDDPQIRDYSNIFDALPEVARYPESNPFTPEKEALGELLFWDPIMSGDQNVACASCHHPDFGWGDGRDFSIGSDGIGLGTTRHGTQVTEFNSPTILNVAFTGLMFQADTANFESGPYFWELRAQTLEDQVLGPLKNPIEMLGYNISEESIMEEIVMRLQSIPEYVNLFELAFGNQDPITSENIAKAIATFERKIISPNSRFDRFLNGETSAFSEAQVIGLNKFIDVGCSRCHMGPMLSNNVLNPAEIVIENKAVRTPMLRNLSLTAPFMHNGSRRTIIDAIADYEDRDDLSVSLGEGDFGDIQTFLLTLDSNDFYKQVPERVPSGLPVGGDIN